MRTEGKWPHSNPVKILSVIGFQTPYLSLPPLNELQKLSCLRRKRKQKMADLRLLKGVVGILPLIWARKGTYYIQL